jgi:phospholipase A1
MPARTSRSLPWSALPLLGAALAWGQPESGTTLADCARVTDHSLRLICYDNLAEATLQQEEVPPGVDFAGEELLVGKRLAEEVATASNAWVILPHHRNYLLPFTYNNSPSRETWELQQQEDSIDKLETKFQISLKTLVWEGILGAGTNLWGAYTQKNWWQLYNGSSPFRETNYQPEVMLTFDNDWRALGFTNTLLGLGIIHESNGKSGELSRSWNRIAASAVLERRRMSLNIRSWYRVPERSEDDDNPDIDDYYGYGDITGIWKVDQHEFSVMLRHNLQSEGRGAVELEWTFPVNRRFKGYVQYFNGYGESLLEYNRSVNRIGIGLSLTDLF